MLFCIFVDDGCFEIFSKGGCHLYSKYLYEPCVLKDTSTFLEISIFIHARFLIVGKVIVQILNARDGLVRIVK